MVQQAVHLHGHRPVAACMAGQVRTFVRADVRRNIYAAMIRPIRADVDVFVSFSFDSSRRNVEVGVNEVRSMLQMFEVERDDFAEREAGSLHGLTSHTPCLGLIRRKEEARGTRYAWILRLRSDVVYTASMPPFHSWPDHSLLTVYSSACRAGPTFFEEEKEQRQCLRTPPHPPVRACSTWRRWLGLGTTASRAPLPVKARAELLQKSGDAGSTSIELENIFVCNQEVGTVVTAVDANALVAPRRFELIGVQNRTGALGCAKDTWGLMTRPAADIYFSRSLLDAARGAAGTRSSPCFIWTACTQRRCALNTQPSRHSSMYGKDECLLGCVLNAHLVKIRPVLHAVHVRNQTAVSSLWPEGWLHIVRMTNCTARTASCSMGFSVGSPSRWKVLQLPT